MIVELRPIDQVIPYDRNPRQVDEAGVFLVAESIEEYGFQNPILVDPAGVIIAGHTRLAAAKVLKHEKVPVIVAEHLSPAQVKAFRIADNRTAQESFWDDAALRAELGDLDHLGFDLVQTGFSQAELDEIRVEIPVEEGGGEVEPSSADYTLTIVCDDESHQTNLLKRFKKQGLKVKAKVS